MGKVCQVVAALAWLIPGGVARLSGWGGGLLRSGGARRCRALILAQHSAVLDLEG